MGAVAVVAAISAACVLLGFWQWGRHEYKAGVRDAQEAAADAGVAELSEVMGADGVVTQSSGEWRTVTAKGTWAEKTLTVLRGRTVDGGRVVQYLAWFVTADGSSLLVDAGWTPATEVPDVGIVTEPALADGTIEVVLRAWEDDDGRGTTSASRITPAQVPDAPTGDVIGGYGTLTDPCVDGACTADLSPVPVPEVGIGPHFAYAIQWWMFAVLVPIAAVLLWRRNRQHAEEDAEEQVPLLHDDSWRDHTTGPAEDEPEPRAGRRRRTDEEIEDAILDAQERALRRQLPPT